MSIDLDKIRRAIKANNYYTRAHARKRMAERDIEREDIEKASLSISPVLLTGRKYI